jgi:hypothetical protein
MNLKPGENIDALGLNRGHRAYIAALLDTGHPFRKYRARWKVVC